MDYINSAWLMIRREWLLAYRKRSQLQNPLLFFIIVATLFPLATTSDQKLLQMMGPGVIWVAALLASLLSLDNLFREDYYDGSLEHLVLSSSPLSLMILSKVLSHWLLLGLPVIIISPLVATMFHLSLYATFILLVTLLLGTPIISFVGAIGAALTVGLRNGGLLLALILLPLYVPTMIFATSAVSQAQKHMPVAGQIALLGALLSLALSLAPIVSAFALRIGVSYDA